MGVITDPKYDGDYTTKQYVDNLITGVTEELETTSQNFGSQPIPPYNINDTYMDGTNIYICITQRLIGSFNAADWQFASAYTDDTLAESKNKVFNTTPTTPYKLGDLWTGGPNGELRRCMVTRSTGLYNETDWENATQYDSTSTVVEGGLVTTGTIQVVQGGTVAAGMTGNSSGDTSIRFWAGSTLANRNSAPFRVTQSGQLVASNAIITGNITANEGTIGGWSITSVQLQKLIGQYSFEIRTDRNSDQPALLVYDTGNSRYNFYVRPDGYLYARTVDISGNISGSTIRGGSINIVTGNYYFNMGLSTSNPSCSGLNVGYYGIKAYSDITATRFAITDGDVGLSTTIGIRDWNNRVHYLTFTGGIITAWDYV